MTGDPGHVGGGRAGAPIDPRTGAPMPGLLVFAPDGLPEVHPGDDLAALLGDALEGLLEDGDIVLVTSKVVSKAEGRLVNAVDREDAITAETVRLVARREHPGGVTRIVQNRNGLVMAAAGVDASNLPEGVIALLPVDPDASARALCTALRERFGLRLGVVVTDTFGRPWREGQTDVAIGAAGLRVLDDLRGTTDAAGKPLSVTAPAVADELAAAADLVKGKATSRPLAVARGLGALVAGLDEPGAAALVRDAERDMFRLGSAEAEAEGYARGYADGATGRPDAP
ncbi:MAG: coenzyme F420-0:L-glutamate ligase [Actinomycetales bacterium]|nr:coenzyme F420-0:L-glutamate ligase [Actinomycetales bacterium]